MDGLLVTVSQEGFLTKCQAGGSLISQTDLHKGFSLLVHGSKRELKHIPSLPILVTLMKEALSSSETA
jgi:hypothetical protein